MAGVKHFPDGPRHQDLRFESRVLFRIQMTIIPSASNSAPLGSAETSTAARAG
jgi:hypothetical protein